jgi:SAM-dependent methyltransferase
MSEFTGERAIPGQIDADLLNEHVARYLFAARLARGKRVLDAGCGAGYGSAELARAAHSVVGLDRAAEAVDFARAHYRLANLFFEQASCAALPHADGAFDLVVSFEVLEHLDDWRGFLLEARRVLAPNGQFVVSTPNKLYYEESRGASGANPFHVHEFEFEELRAELLGVFPHVSMYLENHVEGLVFQPGEPDTAVEVRVDAATAPPSEAHFFVAVCAHRTQLGSPTFIYVPASANVLRERERHIGLLERELADKNEWLAESEGQREKLQEAIRALTADLERSNRWAEELNREIQERRAAVTQLQAELERSNQWALSETARLAAELEESNRWAAGLNGEMDAARARILELQAELAGEQASAQAMAEGYRAVVAELEAELRHRADWANGLQEDVRRLEWQLEAVRASSWVKLGRKIHLGPAV